MPDIVLRRAELIEADAVRNLVRRAYAKWVPVIGREPMPMQADHAAAIRDHLVFVLDGPDGIVALSELKPAADHLLIVNLAVDETLQGKGIGRALLAHAEDLARAEGLNELRLYTNEKMETNRAFYGRHGYEQTGRDPIAGIGVRVNMRKRLRGT